MAIAFDSIGVGQPTNNLDPTVSWSHTHAAGSILVGVVHVGDISSVSIGGVAADFVATVAIGSTPLSVYVRHGVPAGTDTISATAATYAVLGNSMCYTGVDTTGTPNTLALGNRSSHTITTNTDPDAPVVYLFSGAVGVTWTYNRSIRWDANAGLRFGDGIGGASVAHTVSGSASGNGAAIAIPLLPPAGLPVKQYISGSWQQIGVLKAHDGTDWVTPKYWDGSAWV